MNKQLLNKDIQQFITNNLNSNLAHLAFQGSPFQSSSIQEIIQQIESKKKAEKKLPTWFQTSLIYYPPKLHIEQTSSEPTAQYKSNLLTGKKIADLTGGFGVDTYFFKQKQCEVHHYEVDKELSNIAQHNFKQLKCDVTCFAINGIAAIKDKFYDTLYIDPSRRSPNKKKVFRLQDCEPNVIQHYDYLINRCHTLLIKTSPFLDLKSGLCDLHHTKQIHIVAVNNEVKELIWVIDKKLKKTTEIVTVNIQSNSSEIFKSNFDYKPVITFSEPLKYLYEPNASIMKSGLFNAIAKNFNVEKLEKNTHLFTSDKKINFPGRRFEIIQKIPYTKIQAKKELLHLKANITTRNFPENVADLKRKWKIHDGGNVYLFFITDKNNKKLILKCVKI